ncbi:MAG: putative rane protein of unknown function [Hyphomicrobiales bacterium]|nr:putative rane protein of unknown function [Hyphomicrobiales bacterium]
MGQRFLRLSTTALALFLSATTADAHIIAARLGDFYAGALHPLTDLQDVILWTALGVLAGSLGAAKGRWLVLLFPIGLLAGLAVARTSDLALAGPVLDAACIVVLGLLLVTRLNLPTPLLAAIAVVLAVIRGAANGGDLDPTTNTILFASGMAAAGYVAVTLIMAGTVAFSEAGAGAPAGWKVIALRALGSWIAAIGLMMAGLALTS